MNINDRFRFELTDAGRASWRTYMDNETPEYPTELPLWEIVRAFGPTIHHKTHFVKNELRPVFRHTLDPPPDCNGSWSLGSACGNCGYCVHLAVTMLPKLIETVGRQELELRAVHEPVPMRLHCPECHALHLDLPPYDRKPHATHACQSCGACWRPAAVDTVGVQFLPGYKNP